jgi:hypothetical protein
VEAPERISAGVINATAILVIVAAVLVLLAIVRIDNFAENVVAKMTDAVLSRSNCRPRTCWRISETCFAADD